MCFKFVISCLPFVPTVTHSSPALLMLTIWVGCHHHCHGNVDALIKTCMNSPFVWSLPSPYTPKY